VDDIQQNIRLTRIIKPIIRSKWNLCKAIFSMLIL
jgi:hypothetical protein